MKTRTLVKCEGKGCDAEKEAVWWGGAGGNHIAPEEWYSFKVERTESYETNTDRKYSLNEEYRFSKTLCPTCAAPILEAMERVIGDGK